SNTEESEVLDSTEFEFEEPMLNDDNIPVLDDVVEDDIFEDIKETNDFDFDEENKENDIVDVTSEENEKDPFGPDSEFDFIEEDSSGEDDWLNENISSSQTTDEVKVENENIDDFFIED